MTVQYISQNFNRWKGIKDDRQVTTANVTAQKHLQYSQVIQVSHVIFIGNVAMSHTNAIGSKEKDANIGFDYGKTIFDVYVNFKFENASENVHE